MSPTDLPAALREFSQPSRILLADDNADMRNYVRGLTVSACYGRSDLRGIGIVKEGIGGLDGQFPALRHCGGIDRCPLVRAPG